MKSQCHTVTDWDASLWFALLSPLLGVPLGRARKAEVIVTDLTLPQQTVNKIGPTGHPFQFDVTQEGLAFAIVKKPRRGRGGYRCE